MTNDEETARLCRDPVRPCRWDMDREEVARNLAEIKSTLAEIKTDMQVGKQRFSVLENIAYGLCAAIGLTLVGAFIANIINGKGP